MQLRLNYVPIGAMDQKHGSPWDRGHADAYYGRSFDPHYWSEGSYRGDRTEMKDMPPEEIVLYTRGYNDCDSRKDWGVRCEAEDEESWDSWGASAYDWKEDDNA